MPLIKFQTHARVKCAACHCDLLAEWSEEYFTMSVTPCYVCMANAKANVLEDHEIMARNAAGEPQPIPKTFTSPLRFYPPTDPEPEFGLTLRCNFCGQDMGDDEDGEPVTLDMHTRCRAADRAEYLRDASKDGGA